MLLSSEHFSIMLTDSENLIIHNQLCIATQENDIAQKSIEIIHADWTHVKTSQRKITLQNVKMTDQLVFLSDHIWVSESSIVNVIWKTHAQIVIDYLKRKKIYLKIHHNLIWKRIILTLLNILSTVIHAEELKFSVIESLNCSDLCQSQKSVDNILS